MVIKVGGLAQRLASAHVCAPAPTRVAHRDGRIWYVEDPTPRVRQSPYTFEVPSDRERSAVQAGDRVKLLFTRRPWLPGGARTERMWVAVTALGAGGRLYGVLDNEPSQLVGLSAGDTVAFLRRDIISIIWCVPSARQRKLGGRQRNYFDRCLVDDCVLEDGVPVGFIYREAPDMDDLDDMFPDSGWRIRGDNRGLSEDAIDARTASYVALGAVLNADDSWLHLIDAPIGARYLRNFSTGAYVREDDVTVADEPLADAADDATRDPEPPLNGADPVRRPPFWKRWFTR